MKITALVAVGLCTSLQLLSGCSAFTPSMHRFRTTNPINEKQNALPLKATLLNENHHGIIVSDMKRWLQEHAAKPIIATIMSAAIVATPLQLEISQVAQQSATIRVVQSEASALTEQQILVSDVWKEVTRQYVDTTYNGMGEDGWRQKRLEAAKAVATVGPDDKEQVYSAIRTMLKSLNDPYTRFLTPEQYESLTAYAKGGSAGIGVSLIVEPSSGRVMVANTVKNGPAEKGGILPGDIIVGVDGMDVQAATAELVAARCRGEAGTDVNVAVQHAGGKSTPLTLTRAQVKVNPVEASTFISEKVGKIALLKLSAFSQETVSQIVDALRDTKGSTAVVIDLRGNAGGYMPAGVDVAKLFLPPQTRIISEIDKSGRATIYVSDGIGSETQVPLYLLVDKRTASASEILTAALQDNHRATVVGGSKTFGKGRIQNVQGLEDGSGVAVTKAKYMTPSGTDIHGIGITPDQKSGTCGPDDSAADCLAGIL